MWFKTSLLITCLLVQSCSMNFSEWGRTPAAQANFDDMIANMKDFKSRVMGSEKDANCSKEQMDADFKKLMSSVKRDSCSVDNYSIDREDFEKKACPKVKTEGYFDKVVKQTIAEEKSKKPLTYFQNKLDPEFIAFTKEANAFSQQLGPKIHNPNLAIEDRAALLAEYVENVLMPIRDIIVIKRSYVPKENDGKNVYDSLQPYMTQEFVESLGQSEMGLITQGPNPGTTPFYMEVKKSDNGKSYRLQFSPTDIIRHDVLTLLKAPSSKNYVIALKWMTLHMMLSQVYLYETILGNKSDIAIPNACQTHFNGNLPAKFKFSYEDGMGDQFLENILASHGLTYKDDDSSYLDYYIDNVSKDPTKEGYSALVPFENYKNALRSAEGSGPKALEPNFDDLSHFQTIMQYKIGEAQSEFKTRIKGQTVTYAGYETFQKMLGEYPADEIAEITTKDGSEQIYPGKQNLSPYLLELMQENGLIDYSDLITSRMKKKFAGKTVDIDLPSMYSAPVWRDWSLRYLSDTIYNQRDVPTNSKLYSMINSACMMNSQRSPELNKICLQGNIIQNLSDFMAEFRSGEKYIPTRRLEEAKYKELYPFLSYVWKNMRDKFELLPDAKPFELNFLLDQMSAGNPWARLKMSYMVALDQLEYKQEGVVPSYGPRRNAYNQTEAQCKAMNVTVQMKALKAAGEVLGLDKPLSYNHGGSILSTKEKAAVWKNIVDDIQQRNAQLFSVKGKNQSTYYKTAEDLSYKTILTKEAALATGVTLSPKTTTEIKKIAATDEAQLGEFFLKLYKMKDPAAQQKLFEQFSQVNGIDNTFSLKLNFLAMDDAYKKPIYKDLLKQAAQTRKLQILSELDTFCKMDVNDEMEFKNLFYSTTKAQNDLNQMAGLPAVPENVLDQINSMTASEWRDMWWGIGSGIAGMAAIVVGGACTTLSGGICAPLGGAMAVAGISALGIQVKLTANELGRKAEADVSEKQVKIMEDLGFANTGSADEVHRSYAWAAFEAISVFPLIGIATRSLALGPKLVYVSTQSIVRQTGKASFKAAAKTVTQEEEVRAAQYLLGLTSVGKNAGVDAKTLKTATDKITKIRKLYTSGEIDLNTMMSKIGGVLDPIKRAKLAYAKTVRNEIGKVSVKVSQANIDKQTAAMVANYFGDNPKEMLRLIQGYSGERLNKAIRVMGEVNATDRIAKRIPVFGSMKDWYLKMRNEDLAKNAAKILKLEKDLVAMGTNRNQLQAYINKNIEDFTDIFIDIPLRKREIPYFVFIQGMPDINFYKGAKFPVLSMMSEGQTMRRLVTARARLVHETYKSQARATLKLKRYVKSETTYEAFKSFRLSVAELANKKAGKDAAKVMTEYRAVEEQLTKKLYTQFQAGEQTMDYKAFKELLMNPTTLKDKATAEAIWESVPADELMGLKEVGAFAHKAVQELSKYSDVDSFERYLAALRVLVINRNPAVLEVM